MNNATTTKYPATANELIGMALSQGMKPSEFLEQLGPIPMPPAEYSLVEGCTDLWAGQESSAADWTVTPAWNSTTDKHFMEVWTPENNQLTANEARRLAQVLLATADAIDAAAA